MTDSRFARRCLAIDLEVEQEALTVVWGPGLNLSRQLYVVSRKEARLSPAALAFLALAHRQVTF